MASNLISAFKHVIEDKRILEADGTNSDIPNRFSFFVAKKREINGHYYQLQGPSGSKVDARFFYMHDKATDDVYELHAPDKLPGYFLYTAVGAIPVTVITIAWNVAKIVATVVHATFEVFQEIYPTRHSEDLISGFLEQMKNKRLQKFAEMKRNLFWIQTSLGYMIAIEAAVIHALTHRNNEKMLFAMKVVVAHIEYLWNRQVSFRESTCAQLNKLNKDLKVVKEKPRASKYEVITKFLRDMHWKSFFSVIYIMQSFQSRGLLQERVSTVKSKTIRDELDLVDIKTVFEEVEVPKFDIVPGTEKSSYKEFTEEMVKQDRVVWRVNL